ncbi:putative tRNA(His) guanylyltransferase [Helianthus annuus]|nr:putative tRNA(His) guanylyltransferase [Helianthus annuus]KAJ0881748.1 putative tRNA(His) guanylyltransferase [Helianthus annuus]
MLQTLFHGPATELLTGISFQALGLCEIVSAVVSFFSSTYVIKWKEFFPEKELEYGTPPIFDGRAVCYPSYEIIRDYFAWRQVDCHINNQYNTCFWMVVKSGKSTREAQSLLKVLTLLVIIIPPTFLFCITGLKS